TAVGDNYIIANSAFTRTSNAFTGWNTVSNGGGTPYNVGDVINNISENITLYAQWVTIPSTPPSPSSPPANTYVGAFWKNDQTGERLIRIPIGSTSTNLGAWSAVVVDGDFIKMDKSSTADPGVNWNNAAATPADMNTADATYQVPGSATSVSGTVASGDTIYFRIGLTSTIADKSAPRYGRILLTYGGTNKKQQFLYIRQGEEADYVFRPEDTYIDPNAGTQGISRSLAKKFSPYNLTAPELPDGSPYYKDIDVNGGEFVKYPTQAGAFFQWASSVHPRRAYHPTNPLGVPNNWETNYLGYFWNNLGATHETCPVNWRRPNDGITNKDQDNVYSTSDYTANNIYKSEMRQSLYAKPKNGTDKITETAGRALGYYADGYFDRRAIVNGVGDSRLSNSAVSVSTKDVAYIGTLFFNAASGASLFMPAGGHRSGLGQLYYSGNEGFYYNSSAFDSTSGGGLVLSKSEVYHISYNRPFGFAVRCVKEDPVQ
ncbi:MAG: hypothetical protein LBJ17_04400, partial [Dysgonamonadaceae bacterium]|nr:hypothetical protein [Dysgonamonadaceae bacterium]